MKRYVFIVMMVVGSVQNVYEMETKSEADILHALNCVLDLTGGKNYSVASVAKLLAGVPEDRITGDRYYDIDHEARCLKPVCCKCCYTCDCRMYTLNLLQWIFFEWLSYPKKGGFRSLPDGHDMVAMLLKYRFDLNELFYYDSSGWSRLRISVLHAAVMLDDARLVEMILNAGRDTVDVKDSEGYTPFQRLIVRNNKFLASKATEGQDKILGAQLAIAQALIKAKANTDLSDCWMGRWCWRKKLQVSNKEIRDLIHEKRS